MINSQVTKQGYTYKLTRFFGFINLEGETHTRKMQKVSKIKRKKMTGATRLNFVKAIKLFCEMNDILIPNNRIYKGYLKVEYISL